MRILWQSNAPWSPSGYGKVTAEVTKRLKKLGHEVAIFAFYGLKSAVLNWEGIKVYPNECGDWGLKEMPQYFQDFKADILISLVDVYVLRGLGKNVRWFPYFPIDHDPVPPLILEALATAQKPITMSLFGEKQLKDRNIDCYYAPHGVDTKVYFPDKEAGKAFREYNNLENKFVVGFIGSNRVERKNIDRTLSSFAQFHKRCPNSALYLHTNYMHKEGINVVALARDLGIEDALCLPPREQLLLPPNEEQMKVLYNSFDVFFLPSKAEGFGLPIIEAQACGVPVIVTDFTSMPELVGSGWTIKEYTKEWQYLSSWWANASQGECVSLLRKAYRLWENGELEPYKQKAREFALQYDWDLVVDKYWKPILEDIESTIKRAKEKAKPIDASEVIEWKK